MRSGFAAMLMGLVVAIGSLAAVSSVASSSNRKILESTLIGLPEGMTGGAGTIRGIQGAGAPWVADGKVRLGEGGRLRVDVDGLVLAGSFTNPVASVFASLTCEGPVVTSTATVPLSPAGDAKIDEVIEVPHPCVGPIVLVRIGTGTQRWIAATGFNSAPAFKADPFEFDPDDTNIIVADWVDHLGLNDAKGDKRQGLLLSKNGETPAFAAAGAEIERVEGITLVNLGFDVRTGGHCGAGAPRFNVVVEIGGTDALFFFGCSSGAKGNVPGVSPSAGWKRVRFSNANAFPADGVTPWPGFGNAVVQEMAIIFDEGTDTGPDFSGMVVLDNILVNHRYITRENGALAGSDDEFFETDVVGIPTPGAVIRGVTGGGAAWTVDRGEIELKDNGKLRVKVQGLLITGTGGPLDGTTGPVTGVKASLTCLGTNVVATTGVETLSSKGNAKINEELVIPTLCVGPIVLVQIGSAPGFPGAVGLWIAATGFTS